MKNLKNTMNKNLNAKAKFDLPNCDLRNKNAIKSAFDIPHLPGGFIILVKVRIKIFFVNNT